MRAASKRRGIEVTSISRPIRPSDFTEFDLILAMDRQNKGTFVYLFVLTSSTPPPTHLHTNKAYYLLLTMPVNM
jgi:protein-tyrosine-phosphatase